MKESVDKLGRSDIIKSKEGRKIEISSHISSNKQVQQLNLVNKFRQSSREFAEKAAKEGNPLFIMFVKLMKRILKYSAKSMVLNLNGEKEWTNQLIL